MVRWFVNDKKLNDRVRASLPEITQIREDLIVASVELRECLVAMKEGVTEMDHLRSGGVLTEAEHLAHLRGYLKAMHRASGDLRHALYPTRQFHRRPLP